MSPVATAPDTLGQLLRGEWQDPDCGTPLRVPIQVVAIEQSLAGLEADLVTSLGLGRRRPIRSTWFARRVTPSQGAG